MKEKMYAVAIDSEKTVLVGGVTCVEVNQWEVLFFSGNDIVAVFPKNSFKYFHHMSQPKIWLNQHHGKFPFWNEG